MNILYMDCPKTATLESIAAVLCGLTKERETCLKELEEGYSYGITFGWQEEKKLLSVESSLNQGDCVEFLRSNPPQAIRADVEAVWKSVEEGEKSISWRHYAMVLASCTFLKCMKVERVVISRDELESRSAQALLDHYADEAGILPRMKILRSFSAGITAFLGETIADPSSICVIHANIDDMTGEELGFAQEMLWEAGAVDVYTTPIFMKKNRPGTMLSCACKAEKKEACIDAFFRHTTTIGLRFETMERRVLDRSFETHHTIVGDIRVKTCYHKDMVRSKAEFEDLRRIALERNISLREAEQYISANPTRDLLSK